MRQSILQKLKQSRAFFYAIIAVAIVWIVSAMAEVKHFRESYPVAFDNIDTVQYAIMHYDSIITIDISSNGFRAFGRGRDNKRAIHFDLKKNIQKHNLDSIFSLSLQTEEYLDIIKIQLDMRGVTDVKLVTELINTEISIRKHKAFVPDISKVTFSFNKLAGLDGKPRIIPDSIYLYGSPQSLSKIDIISAKEQEINNIDKSGEYKIALDDSWKKYEDLRISNEEIRIFIPVEKYLEKSVDLPITLTDKSDNTQWNLYPSKVTVQLLVPESKAESIDLTKCVVTANAKECGGGSTKSTLTPQLTKFPSCVRLKSISPDKIQYIIIEK